MDFRIERYLDTVILVAHDETGEGRFLIEPAAARVLAADLFGAARAADPAGHQAMIDHAARELEAEALLAAAPVRGSH